MRKHIPNALTCCNLFCGFMALIAVRQNDFFLVACLIGLSAFFDFLDGLAARALHAYSPIGKDLDSLADVVSFGVVPGMIAFQLLSAYPLPWFVPYLAGVIPVASALRLAIFNQDTSQQHDFKGVPTPANALFWIAIPFFLQNFSQHLESLSVPSLSVQSMLNQDLLTQDRVLYILPSFVLFFVFFTSGMLLAPMHIFSAKIQSFNLYALRFRLSFLAGSFVLILFLSWLATPLVYILYVLLSFLESTYALPNITNTTHEI